MAKTKRRQRRQPAPPDENPQEVAKGSPEVAPEADKHTGVDKAAAQTAEQRKCGGAGFFA